MRHMFKLTLCSVALVAVAVAQGPGWAPYHWTPMMGYNPRATSNPNPLLVISGAVFWYTTTVNDKDTWYRASTNSYQEFINPGVGMVHELNSGTREGTVEQSYNSETGVLTHSHTIKAKTVSVQTTFSDKHTFTDGEEYETINDEDQVAYTNVTVNPPQGAGGPPG